MNKALVALNDQLTKAVDLARKKAEGSAESERSYQFGYVHGLERAQGFVQMAIAVEVSK